MGSRGGICWANKWRGVLNIACDTFILKESYLYDIQLQLCVLYFYLLVWQSSVGIIVFVHNLWGYVNILCPDLDVAT